MIRRILGITAFFAVFIGSAYGQSSQAVMEVKLKVINAVTIKSHLLSDIKGFIQNHSVPIGTISIANMQQHYFFDVPSSANLQSSNGSDAVLNIATTEKWNKEGKTLTLDAVLSKKEGIQRGPYKGEVLASIIYL